MLCQEVIETWLLVFVLELEESVLDLELQVLELEESALELEVSVLELKEFFIKIFKIN